MASVVKRLRPRIVVPICVGSNPTRRPFFGVKMRNWLFISLVFLSISCAYATTNRVTVYDCYDGNSTIANIVPGSVWNEKDCTIHGSVSSDGYMECVKAVRDYNQNTLKLYKAGKCKSSGYKISGTEGSTKCSMIYDNNRIKGYSYKGSSSMADSCFKNLAKEIKAQYPNIKGDSKYGFVGGDNKSVKF